MLNMNSDDVNHRRLILKVRPNLSYGKFRKQSNLNLGSNPAHKLPNSSYYGQSPEAFSFFGGVTTLQRIYQGVRLATISK